MNTIKQHSLLQSAGFHLIPGLAGTIVYIFLAPIFVEKGYPAILGILVAAAIVIFPILLGTLLYQARKHNGTFSVKEIILYRETLPKWQYFVLPLLLVIWGFFATGVTVPLDNFLMKTMFSWLPEQLNFFALSNFDGYEPPALKLTFIVGLIVNGIALPFVEELYFRGYLLPRLERFGKWAPLINVSLFSLYHFWTPWQLFSRIFWMLPWVYVTWRKRNIYLIIITHCMANTLGWLLTWSLILGN